VGPPAPRRSGGALLLAAAALALGGCGDDAEGSGEPEAVGEELGGSVAQLVHCADWVKATPEQRLATIEDVRSHVNYEGTGVEAPALSDEEATEVFDNGCDRPEAASYRLHVMYARAAAFKPLRDIAEGKTE